MPAKKTKEQQQQQLAAIAKEYQTNEQFKQQIDQAYEAAKQQSPDQIAQLESQYKENSKIVFAYMMIEQQEQQKANQPKAAASGLPMYSKEGAKLAYISELNGRCPEGYEVEKYLEGGCVKCRKGRALQVQDFVVKPRFSKCGGKAKKHADGSSLTLSNAKKLQYQGGPGDADSTQGMKPNHKQRAMLPKRRF